MANVIAQMWSLIGLFTLLRNILPVQLLQLFNQWWSSAQERFNPYCHLTIPQFYGNYGADANEAYKDVELYLASLDANAAGARRLTVFRNKDSSSVEFCPVSDMKDSFNGATMWWSRHVQPLDVASDDRVERRWFSLKIAKGSTRFLPAYFDYVANRADEFKKLQRGRIIYTNNGETRWSGVPFKHPSTFDSLALDPTLKDKIIWDLDRFRQGKEFHSRVGRPWKRGYLLCGPPGSGKSSMVAAIANYMKYDVYELELTEVTDNSELRALLMQTTDRSIIVIDIDCSLDLPNRLSQQDVENAILDEFERSRCRVILSGFLNFTDQLWSCCREERIVICTSNYKDKIDPALLRTGRMEMYILLSHCTFSLFKSLAFNYLQIEDHPLFLLVEKSMKESEAEMTPAEISEILINHSDDPLKALNGVISALKKNKQIQLTATYLSDFEQQKATEERIPTSHYQEDGGQIAEEAHTQEVGGQIAQEAHTHEDAGQVAEEMHTKDNGDQSVEEAHTGEDWGQIAQGSPTEKDAGQIIEEAHTDDTGRDPMAPEVHTKEDVGQAIEEAHAREDGGQMAHEARTKEDEMQIKEEVHAEEVEGKVVEEAHTRKVGGAYTQGDAGQIKEDADIQSDGSQAMEAPSKEDGAQNVEEANSKEVGGIIVKEPHVQEVRELIAQELARIPDNGEQIAQAAHTQAVGSKMIEEAHTLDSGDEMAEENMALSIEEDHTREDARQIVQEAHTQEVGDQNVKEDHTQEVGDQNVKEAQTQYGGDHIKQEAHTQEGGGQIVQEVHTQEVEGQIMQEAHTQNVGVQIWKEAHTQDDGKQIAHEAHDTRENEGHIEQEAHSEWVGHKIMEEGHTQDDGGQIAQEVHTQRGVQKPCKAHSQENALESRRKKRRLRKPRDNNGDK